MSTMTLDRAATVSGVEEPELLREIHLRQLADIFDARHGAERAAKAHGYAHMLFEMEREARAIRNTEICRMADAGTGPSEVGRALGVQRARGDQVIRSAAASRDHDETLIARLRRQVAAWRRDG